MIERFFTSFGKSMRSILGLSIVWLSFSFLFTLLFIKVPKENESIINVAAGAIILSLAGVNGYYFGASKDKSDQEKAERTSETNV